jgi:site-specific recombinase XerD
MLNATKIFMLAYSRDSKISGTPYSADSDWLFASEFKNGVEPYWPDSLLKHFVKPAVRAEITKRVGWHTFRHSYSTQLRANGTDIKVQQESLRHSNVQTTLQVYTHNQHTEARSSRESCRAVAL